MGMVRHGVKRKGVRNNQIVKNNRGATVGRANCRTTSPATAGLSLELKSNTMKFAATFTSRGRRRGASSRRRVELLSSVAESRRDGAKAASAKVGMTKADADHFGCRAAQLRYRRPSVMSVGAADEQKAIAATRQVRPERIGHLSRMLMHTELRSAQTDLRRRGRKSSEPKYFLDHRLVLGAATIEIGKKTMNRAHHNSEEQLAGLQWTELRSSRSLPASAERRRRPAKPEHPESAIATREPRCLQVRLLTRMEIQAEVHCRSEAGTRLKRAPRCGGRVRVERMRALRSDPAGGRSRVGGGIPGPSVRSALRFQARSIRRGPREILCGDWKCD